MSNTLGDKIIIGKIKAMFQKIYFRNVIAIVLVLPNVFMIKRPYLDLFYIITIYRTVSFLPFQTSFIELFYRASIHRLPLSIQNETGHLSTSPAGDCQPPPMFVFYILQNKPSLLYKHF